jgi:hypothetical protein
MAFLRTSAGVTLRILIAGLCCLGIWYSVKIARADYLFRQDTEASVRAAIRQVPDNSAYYMRLAQFDQEHTREMLTTALRLNRYNAQADIELGLQYEADGDDAKAEKMLLDAYEADHTYVPRWSLANFYLRHDNMPAFWTWTRRAAEMPADDIGLLFDLCWQVSPDPQKIATAVLNDNPALLRQYIGFLLTKDQAPAASLVAQRLIRSGDAETDRSLLFSVINRLIATNEASAANTLWHLLMDWHWAAADATQPNNAEFRRKPLPVLFDWNLPEYTGLHSWPGPSGLEVEFSGSQPENCIVAEQAIVLTPGNYTLEYSYHTTDISPDTGIRWQIFDARSNTVLAESPYLSSNDLKQAEVAFTVPPGVLLLRLDLGYKRAIGTTRITGTLGMESVHIQPSH